MAVDFESFSNVLKHPIRRKIILALGANRSLSYVELLNITETANTGKFNYHLKVLADLIEKDNAGKYGLTEKGQLALQFLQKFPEKKIEPASLRMSDALLIGFVGFVLIFANPSLPFGLWASSRIEFSDAAFFLIGGLSLLYGLIVPSGVMWLLTVRRSHSHDMYDLFKSSLVSFIFTLPILIAMFVFKVTIVAKLAGPSIPIGNYGHSQHMAYLSLNGNLFQGLILAFLGVSVFELAYRTRKRHKGLL